MIITGRHPFDEASPDPQRAHWRARQSVRCEPCLADDDAWRPSTRTPNLVILVVESLGADFVGSLGGLLLTPNLDRLSTEGLWFTELYATGTRTVRGLEAIVAGFPPTAAQSVLKRPESQHGFFTLAALLQQQGYRTRFIYGGVSNFDNMGRFFRTNGFERIIPDDRSGCSRAAGRCAGPRADAVWKYQRSSSDRELERDALAHLLWAETVYCEHRYQLTGADAGENLQERFRPTIETPASIHRSTPPVRAVRAK